MKNILCILLASFAACTQVSAQVGINNKQKNNAHVIASERTAEMARNLNLSQAQQKNIQAINLKLALIDCDLNSPNGKVKTSRNVDYANRSAKAYRQILTPLQYEKWEAQNK